MTRERNVQGRRVALLVADGFELVELERSRQTLQEAGALPQGASLKRGEVQGMEGDLQPAGRVKVDRVLSGVSVDDFDALVLPGVTVNPDKLRINRQAMDFVRAFSDAGKPIAAICHGLRMTSWPSLRTDLVTAAPRGVDEEVVVDRGVVTSRNPGDLPAFTRRLLEEFAQGEHSGKRQGRSQPAGL